jgi:hypothetical protein
MKKLFAILSISILLVSCDPATLQRAIDTVNQSAPVLTDQEVGSGLKEALTLGVSSGVDYLSAQDGYYKSIYKILLPAEAQTVVNKLKVIPGFEMVEEEVVKRINKSAELAASKAKPIFINAIKQLTFQDVWNILTGEKNAATQYLYRTSYDQLNAEFQPVIIQSLNQFNALDYWTQAVTKYNSIPFVKKVDPKLENYITQKALEGLFDMVEKKELGIRQNISERTSDLLRRVFARQDK